MLIVPSFFFFFFPRYKDLGIPERSVAGDSSGCATGVWCSPSRLIFFWFDKWTTHICVKTVGRREQVMLQKESKAGKKTELARAKHKHLVRLQEELLPWCAISATFCSAAAAGSTSVHQYGQTSSISADFPPIALFHLQSHCSYIGLALRSPDGARQGEEQQRQEPCKQPCTRVCTAGRAGGGCKTPAPVGTIAFGLPSLFTTLIIVWDSLSIFTGIKVLSLQFTVGICMRCGWSSQWHWQSFVFPCMAWTHLYCPYLSPFDQRFNASSPGLFL